MPDVMEVKEQAHEDESTILTKIVAGLEEMGLLRGPRDICFAEMKTIDPAYVIFDDAYAEAVIAGCGEVAQENA